MMSDHSLVNASIDAFSCNAKTRRVQRVQRCRWALFNKADFISVLQQSRLFVDPPSDVDEHFECYDDKVLSVLNRHAPFVDMNNYVCAASPWYDRDCYVMKLQTRRLEKACRSHPATSTAWRAQFHRQRTLYQRRFTEYWSHAINSCGINTKTLWHKMKCLLSPTTVTNPHHSANEFIRHFMNKVDRIREATSGHSPPVPQSRTVTLPLAQFRLATVEEVAEIIKKSPANSTMWFGSNAYMACQGALHIHCLSYHDHVQCVNGSGEISSHS